jgi:hypothetical protein
MSSCYEIDLSLNSCCISAHYLFFSLIFLYAAPITFVLLPVVLFAVLHSASYSLTLLDTLGKADDTVFSFTFLKFSHVIG